MYTETRDALARAKGNRKQAAVLLGIGAPAVQNRLKLYPALALEFPARQGRPPKLRAAPTAAPKAKKRKTRRR